jgi:hypothetical protein
MDGTMITSPQVDIRRAEQPAGSSETVRQPGVTQHTS